MILADNGSPLYMSGVPDPGWNNSDLNLLKAIPGLGVRGGRRLQLDGFEHLVCSRGRATTTTTTTTSTTTPPPPLLLLLRLLRPSSCPTPASRLASMAGRRATSRRRSRACAPLPTRLVLGRARSLAVGHRAARHSPDTLRRPRRGPPTPRRCGCAHRPDARSGYVFASSGAARPFAPVSSRPPEPAAGNNSC